MCRRSSWSRCVLPAWLTRLLLGGAAYACGWTRCGTRCRPRSSSGARSSPELRWSGHHWWSAYRSRKKLQSRSNGEFEFASHRLFLWLLLGFPLLPPLPTSLCQEKPLRRCGGCQALGDDVDLVACTIGFAYDMTHVWFTSRSPRMLVTVYDHVAISNVSAHFKIVARCFVNGSCWHRRGIGVLRGWRTGHHPTRGCAVRRQTLVDVHRGVRSPRHEVKLDDADTGSLTGNYFWSTNGTITLKPVVK